MFKNNIKNICILSVVIWIFCLIAATSEWTPIFGISVDLANDIVLGVGFSFFSIASTIVFVEMFIQQINQKVKIERELNKIKLVKDITDIYMNMYRTRLNMLITSSVDYEKTNFNEYKKFKLKDLHEMYSKVWSSEDPVLKSRIERYVKAENDLIDHFKFLLKNIDFEYFCELKEYIIKFLSNSIVYDTGNLLCLETQLSNEYKSKIMEMIYLNQDDLIKKFHKGMLDGEHVYTYVYSYIQLAKKSILARKIECRFHEIVGAN